MSSQRRFFPETQCSIHLGDASYLVLCGLQIMSPDVAPAHRPIMVAACRDVIKGHLPSSWQRSASPRHGEDTVTREGRNLRCPRSPVGAVGEVESCGPATALVKNEEICDDNDVLADARPLSTGLAPSPAAAAAAAVNNDDKQPLDLTGRGAGGTNTSPGGADVGLITSCRALMPGGGGGVQMLVLNGRRYEILPVGHGRWVSRSDYEQLTAATPPHDDADPGRRR